MRLKRQLARLRRALIARRTDPAPPVLTARQTPSSPLSIQLKEIEHRAKNSLQLAAAMLLVQRKKIRDPVLRGHLETAALRLACLSGLHGTLHETDWTDGVPLKSWLQRVCEGLPAGPGIIIDIIAPEEPWPVELARPIGLFAFEAVANALKHGFRDEENGRIIVSLSTTAEGHCLEVHDDGCGASPEPVPGLGMTLCRLFADQIGGTHSMDCADQAGFRTRIRFSARP